MPYAIGTLTKKALYSLDGIVFKAEKTGVAGGCSCSCRSEEWCVLYETWGGRIGLGLGSAVLQTTVDHWFMKYPRCHTRGPTSNDATGYWCL